MMNPDLHTGKDAKVVDLVQRITSKRYTLAITPDEKHARSGAKPLRAVPDDCGVRLSDGNGTSMHIGAEPSDIGNGVTAKIVSNTSDATVIVWQFPEGTALPCHTHEWTEDHFVATGHVLATIDGVNIDLYTGGRNRVLSGQEHCIKAVTESTMISVCHPALLPPKR